jgi:HPt (histidine-containing phosphotransfer) domain-containing protein
MMPNDTSNSGQKIRVAIDPDLAELVPGFLENRGKDLVTIRAALDREDFSVIRTLGHRMKGDGGGYGFDRISEIGAAIEQAANRRDKPAIDRQLHTLSDYLAHIEVVYRQ